MGSQFVPYFGMVLVGMILGAIFFGGLWLTVRQMTVSKRPGLLFVASIIFRSAAVLVGIWYCARDDALAIGCCLLGFVVVRLLATSGISVDDVKRPKQELHQ